MIYASLQTGTKSFHVVIAKRWKEIKILIKILFVLLKDLENQVYFEFSSAIHTRGNKTT